MNDNEIKELIWGYETFQHCIPKEYHTDIALLIGKYYSTHPTNEVIEKIGNMMYDIIKLNNKEINFVKYIKEHYND